MSCPCPHPRPRHILARWVGTPRRPLLLLAVCMEIRAVLGRSVPLDWVVGVVWVVMGVAVQVSRGRPPQTTDDL